MASRSSIFESSSFATLASASVVYQRTDCGIATQSLGPALDIFLLLPIG
jgi:hypothetical protein